MAHASADSLSAVLEVSHKFYERSLILYPSDLRRDFGADMLEVFDAQVSEAYSRSGFRGLVGVWLHAAREYFTIALPGRVAERMLPIIAVTTALAFMVWFAGYIGYVMQSACPGCGQ